MRLPSIRTWPLEGRSRPPRICSSVVLPEPEAPTIATVSPAATATSMPFSTSSRWPASSKCLRTSSQRSTTASVMSQGPRRIGPRGAPGWINGGNTAKRERRGSYSGNVPPLDVRRQIAHEIHARVEKARVEQALETVHERLQVDRQQGAESHAAQRPKQPDHRALCDEHREHAARRCTHGTQDRD